MRVLAVFVSLLLFIAVSCIIGFFLLMSFLDQPAPALTSDGVIFTVERGETGISVAARLGNLGLIRSRNLFRALMILKPQGGDVKAGTYRLLETMRTTDVLDLIRSGRELLLKVTVPEGYTVNQTAALFEHSGILMAAEFLGAASSRELLASMGITAVSAEGYLFPDSYYFAKNTPADTVVSTLVSTYRARLERELPESVSLDPEELRQRLVLASIVEREYRAADEAPLMAGVFHNRIRRGMKLQSCATVVYVMTEILKKPHPEKLLFADLEVDNRYNTYLYPGIPPGPICSPGLVALKAAFRPEASSYLYFRLVDPVEGRHHFSETFDEHEQAQSLFVKGVDG
ncbi:MAG: endolytic transglycosylase MltG [Spirochaetes bacterium]|nr:endolytic transglycosylase MltG [Spirochaetota bacterium]